MKIGIIGAGHLGKIHIKCVKNIPEYSLHGFYDSDLANAINIQNQLQVPYFDNLQQLIEEVDVVDIVTPTIAHFEIAAQAIRKGKHVFIEKPITATVAEAKKLLALANEAQILTQVGHVERFNPAFLSVKDQIDKPMFIECHRLALFNPRGLDVPVVLDLMIHDIDIILSVVKQEVKKVSASGIAIVSDTPDIANARLEFANGCVANLTASRISLKNMRKNRFFQKNEYISVDMLEKKSEIVRMTTLDPKDDNPFAMIMDVGNGKQKQITIINPEVQEINAIEMELSSFLKAIQSNTPSLVPFSDGAHALEVAYKIMDAINQQH